MPQFATGLNILRRKHRILFVIFFVPILYRSISITRYNFYPSVLHPIEILNIQRVLDLIVRWRLQIHSLSLIITLRIHASIRSTIPLPTLTHSTLGRNIRLPVSSVTRVVQTLIYVGLLRVVRFVYYIAAEVPLGLK
jgi:hypothetical protein